MLEKEKCYWHVYGFFGNEKKAKKWFTVENPLLGYVTPNSMLESGRGKKLLKFIENQLSQNKPVDELHNWHWPYAGVNMSGAKEYDCPHGVGHGGIHGCDGCCGHESFRRVTQKKKQKRKKKKK